MIIEKDISQLAVGSYITEIVSQSGAIKIKTAGWVRDFAAIERLIQQGVKRVKVDTSKQLENSSEQTPVDSHANAEQSSDNLAAEQRHNQVETALVRHPSKLDFSERLIEAKKVFDDAKHIQARLLEKIVENRPLDVAVVESFVDQSIQMIFDNPDALTCVLGIRIKDHYLLEHSVSVSILMSVFAVHMGMEPGLVKQLATGAFLHDVGKIKVPDKILNKPGRLDPEEFETMKMHATYSAEIVNGTQGLSQLSKDIVANHHEKLNGEGYPKGLGETQLSLYDRMISICDIFDALSADRVYKEGMNIVKCFTILRELGSMGHLDKSLVDRFIHCLGVYPVGSLVQLRSKRLAIVEQRNEDSPTKPQVSVFYNLSRNAFTEIRKLDLGKNPNESIEKAVKASDFGLDMAKVSEFLMMQG